MVDAYSLEQRFVRLDRRLRRAQTVAIAALALAAALGSCAVYFALRTPGRLTIGDVTIDGHQISVAHDDLRSGISAKGLWSHDAKRFTSVGPADLGMRILDGAKINLWADDHTAMLGLEDAPDNTTWMATTSPKGVMQLSRGSTVDQRVDRWSGGSAGSAEK
ncbi:MAG TPA: hypothetical protein VGL61_02180 [Kofleriaceae bacterium]|jgi:hypothetical protein